MKEYQIVVNKINLDEGGQEYYYTAQYRNVSFLWRSRWKDLIPMCVNSYSKADHLIAQHLTT